MNRLSLSGLRLIEKSKRQMLVKFLELTLILKI